MTRHNVLTIGLECSEKGGEQGAADTDVHKLRKGVQSQLRGEVIEERVWVLTLVLLHQLNQILHREGQRDTQRHSHSHVMMGYVLEDHFDFNFSM